MADDSVFEHSLKNQLAIILGFAELLISDSGPDDPRRADLQEIHTAAVAALALLDREYGAPV